MTNELTHNHPFGGGNARATLVSLLEDQADFASMCKWIHCGNSYSQKCGSIERIEARRESPIGLVSASGTRSRQFAFGDQRVSDGLREHQALLHLTWNRASEKLPQMFVAGKRWPIMSWDAAGSVMALTRRHLRSGEEREHLLLSESRAAAGRAVTAEPPSHQPSINGPH
jgi:hypothetical protein